MRVKRLKMQSFRGIGDLTLDFDEVEPTVFVGINGVGKSSILDCIAILLSQFTGRIQESFVSVRSFGKQDITTGEEYTYNETTIFLNSTEFILSLTQVKDERFHTILSASTDLIEANQMLDKIKSIDTESIQNIQQRTENLIKKLKDFLDNNFGFSILSTDMKLITDELIEQININRLVSIPLLIYYPVNRAVFDIPLEIEDNFQFNQIDAYENSLTGGKIDFKSFFQWFRNREDIESEMLRENRNYQDKQLEAVKKAISSLIPGFSNLRVRRSPNLRMTVQKQGEELIINQLSDGEKCLLAMVGDLARRLAIANPGLEDPLAGTGVVLIDEIELHLHPNWQRKIIPALTRTFPNCQFIVTTHSPQVISHVKPQGIYKLKKTDSGVIAQRPESAYGRDSNQILEDIMDDTERPLEIKDSLHDLFQLIEKGNLDDARRLSQQIAEIMGESDPVLVKARVSIRRKEILNR